MNQTTVTKIAMKFEVAIVPVSDVDRAKKFYTKLGWRVDDDIVNGDDFRAVQLTPPNSAASITFGKGVADAKPGSFRGGLVTLPSRTPMVTRGSSRKSRSGRPAESCRSKRW
jgi:catechol 2,3-dioxygenase-like lactoylglutathione lyase family enzyme